MSDHRSVPDLLRDAAPQVLGALVRRYGDFSRCEDAVQESLISAAEAWPRTGIPSEHVGWLVTVASRRYVDSVRADVARERREEAVAVDEPPQVPDRDDSLLLLFLCCHPALTPSSQLALVLRAVGGLTTREIAAGFLVPEPTMAQRISRAKRQIDAAGARFEMPPDGDVADRLAVVQHSLYLIFNEGYSASSGTELVRTDLSSEAIRLTRALRHSAPDSVETAGLLSLMLLTDSRRAARIAPDGSLVPLADQDRSRWNASAIEEGVALVTEALQQRNPGPYQLQAAIAAVHCESPSAEETDWTQILGLYDVLTHVAPNPVATLNRVVAVGEVHGPDTALALLNEIATGPLDGHHRVDAIRAYFLARRGDYADAADAYRAAAAHATNVPEQRYLQRRAVECASRIG